MSAAQEKLAEVCSERRRKAEDLENGINERLEGLFKQEDARIQSVVKVVKESVGDDESPGGVDELVRKARLTLLRSQKYLIVEGDLSDSCELIVELEASLEYIYFEERKPTALTPVFTEEWELSLSFAFFDEDEAEALKEVDSPSEAEVKAWEKGHEEGTSKILAKEFALGSGDEPIFFRSTFSASTTYRLRMRIAHQGMSTQWSDEAEFTTPEFKECCVWKECPDDVDEERKYSVDERNSRIATAVGGYS